MNVEDEVSRAIGVKFHPLAIIVATLCYFGLGAVWFTLLKRPWEEGIGRTDEQLAASGVSPAMAYIVAILLTLALALFLTWLIQKTGPLTVGRGIQVAVVLWFCTIFVAMATEYAFEGRSVRTLAIVAGYPLVGMVLMGAVLGGWTRKQD
jgi:membrane-anchored protein YejM (alkaline phosphatase superfamily)